MSPDSGAASPAKFRMRDEMREEAIVIHCVGGLTSEYTGALKSYVKEKLPHTKRIILELSELVRMDSSGIGAIVGLYVSAKKQNCEVLVINYNSAIRDLFGITNVLSMFEDCARSGMRMP